MLQHAVKVDILRRSSRGTRLTEAGEALLLRIKLAFAEARAMEGELAAWRGDVRGRVVIGALPLAVSLFLPQAVSAVRRLHPELHITVVDGTYESLMHQLLHADIDVIVGALREAPTEVRQDVRISGHRGRPFRPIVDGISDERGRCFRLIVDDVSA